MKVTVYVPDDLWKQAHTDSSERNPSQLVQQALLQMVARSKVKQTLLRQRPANSRMLIEQVRERVIERARARYEAGYHAGLELVESLPWGVVDQLKDAEGDLWILLNVLDQARKVEHDGETWLGEKQPYYDHVEEARNAEYIHEETYRNGFSDAIADIWNAVVGVSPSPDDMDDATWSAVLEEPSLKPDLDDDMWTDTEELPVDGLYDE